MHKIENLQGEEQLQFISFFESQFLMKAILQTYLGFLNEMTTKPLNHTDYLYWRWSTKVFMWRLNFALSWPFLLDWFFASVSVVCHRSFEFKNCFLLSCLLFCFSDVRLSLPSKKQAVQLKFFQRNLWTQFSYIFRFWCSVWCQASGIKL